MPDDSTNDRSNLLFGISFLGFAVGLFALFTAVTEFLRSKREPLTPRGHYLPPDVVIKRSGGTGSGPVMPGDPIDIIARPWKKGTVSGNDSLKLTATALYTDSSGSLVLKDLIPVNSNSVINGVIKSGTDQYVSFPFQTDPNGTTPQIVVQGIAYDHNRVYNDSTTSPVFNGTL